MNKSSKIFIAGHNGLVGSALVRKLQEHGYGNLALKTSKELDLRRQTDVEAFFAKEKPDQVFLCAAKVGGILENNTYKADFIYDNIMIAANVINAAYRNGVEKLLNLGSSCIYPKFAPQPMKEEHLLTGLLEPTNEPYAIAKISAIKLCRYYNEQYGTNFISVMPANLYGSNDNFDLVSSHVLPALIRKFHLAKLLQTGQYDEIEKDIQRFPGGFDLNLELNLNLSKFGITRDFVTIWGSGEPFREFLHVDDLADACLLLMEKYSYKDIGEFINIGTGEDIKIKVLAVMIKDIVGFSGEIRHDTSKPDGAPKKLLDVSWMKKLSWTAGTHLEDGIRKSYQWYCESGASLA
jgi:GDP-L-fucose synthase